MKFETKKKSRQDIKKLEKEKKQLIEKREINYDLYKAIIAIMLQENRKCIEIDFRDVLAADDYELAFCNNPLKTTKEIKLIRRSLMTNEQREAVETMQHWIEYEKEHKDEINKADELIHIQDTVLSLIKQKDKQIDLMAEYMSKQDIEEDICMKNKTNPDWCNEDYTNCKDCIKKYFEGLVEKE